MTAQAPIGVFDSGFGGLSVLREIHSLLPAESLIYCADHASLPYGERDVAVVRARAHRVTQALVDAGAKAIVIACNTATAAAADSVRSAFSVPVIGMEPAVKPAAAATRSGVIGVLGTGGTLASARFAGLLERYADGLQVVTRPCPELVELVEATEFGDPPRQPAVDAAVAPLLARGADVLVLGCTHFPFLRREIETAAGERAVLIDTGPAVARQLARRLAQGDRTATPGRDMVATFWTTGPVDRLQGALDRMWGNARLLRAPVEPNRIAAD